MTTPEITRPSLFAQDESSLVGVAAIRAPAEHLLLCKAESCISQWHEKESTLLLLVSLKGQVQSGHRGDPRAGAAPCSAWRISIKRKTKRVHELARVRFRFLAGSSRAWRALRRTARWRATSRRARRHFWHLHQRNLCRSRTASPLLAGTSRAWWASRRSARYRATSRRARPASAWTGPQWRCRRATPAPAPAPGR